MAYIVCMQFISALLQKMEIFSSNLVNNCDSRIIELYVYFLN